MRYYLDSTALVGMLKFERRTADLLTLIDGAEISTSELAITELQLALVQSGVNLAVLTPVREVLTTYSIEQAVLNLAGRLDAPGLKAVDAIHLATALNADVDGYITFDPQQALAARAVGLPVVTI
ncbi:MAG: hypothetical protein RL038_605 [Actinomycetota bacterium]